MALKGTFSVFGLPDIFQLISQQRKTGILTVSSGESHQSVHFYDGDINNVTSPNMDASMLLRNHLLSKTRDKNSILVRVVKNYPNIEMPLAEFLLSNGYLAKEHLAKAITTAVQEKCFDLFLLRSGEYVFEEVPITLSSKIFDIRIQTESVVFEGIRRLDEWNVIIDVFPNGKIVPIKILKEDIKSKDLERDEELVYAEIDNNKNIDQLRYVLGVNRFTVYHACYNLYRKGLIKPKQRTLSFDTTSKRRTRHHVLRKALSYAHALIIIFILLATIPLIQAIVRIVFPNPEGQVEEASFLTISSFQTQYKKEKLIETLHLYAIDNGYYPDTLNELAKEGFAKKSFIKTIRKMGFIYNVKPNGKDFSLFAP